MGINIENMKYIVFVAYYLFALLVILGCGYVVFWRGESGWWFVLAVSLTQLRPEFKKGDE